MNTCGRVRAHGVFLLCTATATALPAIAPAQQIAVGGYAVPTVNNYNPASYGVEGITAGPDGALWVYGIEGQQDRPDHHRRGDHRVPRALPEKWRWTRGDHSGAGWCVMVYRT